MTTYVVLSAAGTLPLPLLVVRKWKPSLEDDRDMWNDEDDVEAEGSRRHSGVLTIGLSLTFLWRGQFEWKRRSLCAWWPWTTSSSQRRLNGRAAFRSWGARGAQPSVLEPHSRWRHRQGCQAASRAVTDAYNMLWYGAHSTGGDGEPDLIKFKGLELELSLASLKGLARQELFGGVRDQDCRAPSEWPSKSGSHDESSPSRGSHVAGWRSHWSCPSCSGIRSSSLARRS